ncbi:serine protease [Nonomuraea sp. NBC_01738]|uniref:trypsin-like serine peptidase n=1 Tax=Nonomuraea sp. NBC_01738 TaxID=2976003 RepID=UPI002E12A21A|nr:serine protease [Nonomuraea sp. NBC_01738]
MISRARRIAIPLAGLVAIGMATGLMSTSATAQAPKDVVTKNATTPAAQAVQFWTPDRIRLATDMSDSLDISSKGVKGGTQTPDGPPGSVPPVGEEKTKTSKSKHVNLPNTVGRVFFTLPGANPYDPKSWRFCSASSVQSKYRNLVATSAHCVYDTKKDVFYDNWVFIPSYWDGNNAWEGKAPYGIYAAKTFNAHDDFVVKEDYDFDYAFVNVYNGIKVKWEKVGNKWEWTVKNVGRLGDNVGGQGFTWNRSTKVNVFSFGYPAGEHPDGDKPFTGRTMKWCYGKTKPMPEAPKYNLQEHVGFKCSFTAGASGGPFIYNYKSASRTGYLVGVNSVAWDTDGNDRYDHISSPYFNTDTYKVYKAAANRWTGNFPVK